MQKFAHDLLHLVCILAEKHRAIIDKYCSDIDELEKIKQKICDLIDEEYKKEEENKN